MEAFPHHIEPSKSLESVDRGPESYENYLSNLETDLDEEIERILSEERFLGEGRAAKVHAVEMKRSHCKACVKIWKPELNKILAEDVVQYKKIQSQDPHQEFEMQDELYMAGFKNIPRPLAYTQVGEFKVLAMEEIQGYTLRDIEEAGGKIVGTTWSDLKNVLLSMNKEFGIVHRDLHTDNIMIRTKDKLEPGAEINGEIVILDFGNAKRISFSAPEPDDYKLTIGQKTVQFESDEKKLLELKPSAQGNSPFAR